MTISSEIIKRAYRENNLISLHEDLSSVQLEEGMVLLNETLSSVFGNEIGESITYLNLFDTVENSGVESLESNELPANTHVVVNSPNSYPNIIKFPSNPQDGCRIGVIDSFDSLATYPITFDGNGRKIGDTETSIPVETTEWFYRADLGKWQKISLLTSTDVFPLPASVEGYFTTLLSARLSSRNGTSASAEVALVFRQFMKKFVSRYKQNVEMPTEAGLCRLPSRKYMVRTSLDRG